MCVCWQTDLASVTDWLCHHQVPWSSSPAWHEGPSSHPSLFSNCLQDERSAVYFNKDKRDNWQRPMPKMSLFSLRSFQEHLLHEAGFLRSVDQWKCLGEAHGKTISDTQWCLRLGVDGSLQCRGFWKCLKGGCPSHWAMEGRPVPCPWCHQLDVANS